MYITVDKLNKSKLTGNVNVNKMVLPLVRWWWCRLCLILRQLTTMSSTPAAAAVAAAAAEAEAEAEKATAALAAAGVMTAMSDDDDDDDDGYNDDGWQQWRRLPAPVPIDDAS